MSRDPARRRPLDGSGGVTSVWENTQLGASPPGWPAGIEGIAKGMGRRWRCGGAGK